MIIVPQIKVEADKTADFHYLLPYSDEVSIKIYDHHGNEMETVLNCRQEAGEYNIRYDTSTLPTGKYFYMIRTNQDTVVKLMTVDKSVDLAHKKD